MARTYANRLNHTGLCVRLSIQATYRSQVSIKQYIRTCSIEKLDIILTPHGTRAVRLHSWREERRSNIITGLDPASRVRIIGYGHRESPSGTRIKKVFGAFREVPAEARRHCRQREHAHRPI